MSIAQRPVRWQRPVRLAVTALVAVLALLCAAAPASAHAELVASDPVEGAVLTEAPSEVTLTFNEPVRLTGQPITVYDASGRAVTAEASSSGTEVTVRLPGAADLGEGTYVVGWYVLSGDGHPISGSLTFSVGEASAAVVEPPPPPVSSDAVTVTQGILHALTYLALMVAAGLAVFLTSVLPRSYAGQRVRGRIRRLIRLAAILAAAGAVLQVPVAAVYAQGLELPDLVGAFDAGLVANEVVLALLVVLALGAWWWGATDRPPHRRQRIALLAGSASAVIAPAVVGHTRAYQPEALLVAADVLHVAAGSIWLGGLVGLVIALRPLAGRERLAAETLTRFSTIAGGLLLAVAASGTVLAWRILGSWSAFVETTYGVLLLVKIGIALLVAGIAGWNRLRLLPRVRSAAGFDRTSRAATIVTRTVAAEAALLAILLGVTGFLVNGSPRPAPVEVPLGRTGVQEAVTGDLRVLVMMTPAKRGTNDVFVQVQDAQGEPVELPQHPEVQLRTEGLDLGSVPVTHSDAGTWQAAVLLPTAGHWEVQVSVTESRFESRVTTVMFDVAELS